MTKRTLKFSWSTSLLGRKRHRKSSCSPWSTLRKSTLVSTISMMKNERRCGAGFGRCERANWRVTMRSQERLLATARNRSAAVAVVDRIDFADRGRSFDRSSHRRGRGAHDAGCAVPISDFLCSERQSRRGRHSAHSARCKAAARLVIGARA